MAFPCQPEMQSANQCMSACHPVLTYPTTQQVNAAYKVESLFLPHLWEHR